MNEDEAREAYYEEQRQRAAYEEQQAAAEEDVMTPPHADLIVRLDQLRRDMSCELFRAQDSAFGVGIDIAQEWAERAGAIREALAALTTPASPQPTCPKCGSANGSLGTSEAYFICGDCKREQYWTPDHEHPGDWAVAIAASPYGRRSELLQQIMSLRAKATTPAPDLRAWVQHKADCETWRRLYSVAIHDPQGGIGGMRTPNANELEAFEKSLRCTCGLDLALQGSPRGAGPHP